MTTATASKSRRLLLPLATVVAAAAIAATSGATFTSQSANAASVATSGTLSQSNSRANEAIFTGTNLKPGDTVTGTVTIANTGSLPSTFTVSETASNGFATPSALQLTISEGGDRLYAGTFGQAGTIDLGTFAAGESRTYTYVAALDANASNSEQGRTASASYVWDAVQTDATDFQVTGGN